LGKIAALAVLPMSLLIAFPQSEVSAQSPEDTAPATLPDSSTNDGDADTGRPTFGGEATDDGDITAGVETGPSGGRGGSGSPGPATFGPQCTWVPATTGNLAGASLPSDVVDNSDIDAQITNSEDEFGWLRLCPGDLVAAFVWQGPVDPVDLVPGAADRAHLPRPVPNMSPAPEIGSVVNLGLWFAVEDPGVTTARASLGTAWSTVQGSFASVSINPGDGSPPVTCEGFGTPYPDGSDDPDERPCGHTYLQRTSDDQPHQMTYTITYALNWRTSDGGSGGLGTFDRAVTFDYDIDEIQTVGTG
jgi:hypothetical protein